MISEMKMILFDNYFNKQYKNIENILLTVKNVNLLRW